MNTAEGDDGRLIPAQSQELLRYDSRLVSRGFTDLAHIRDSRNVSEPLAHPQTALPIEAPGDTLSRRGPESKEQPCNKHALAVLCKRKLSEAGDHADPYHSYTLQLVFWVLENHPQQVPIPD